jgi:hypothetical protein
MYAHRTTSGWEHTVVDDSERVGRSSAIALDSLDQPHIAYRDLKNNYHDSDRQALKHVYWDGAAWIVSIVGSPAGIGGSTSLAVGPDGNPNIAYCDGVDRAIKYAQRAVVQGRALLPWVGNPDLPEPDR